MGIHIIFDINFVFRTDQLEQIDENENTFVSDALKVFQSHTADNFHFLNNFSHKFQFQFGSMWIYFSLHIYPISLLPVTRGHPGAGVLLPHRHVVPGMHPG